MEAKVLAAVLAFAVLVGIGIGWQLPRREASPVTLERTHTVTVTAVRTVTWTVFPGEVGTTVTVTKSLGPLLKLLIPAGTYNCNSSELLVVVTVANVGDEPATVDLGRLSFGLRGVREENRTVMGPGIPQNQMTLLPGEDVRLTLRFSITDHAELSKYVKRSQFGTPILSLNLTIPYSWRGGSSELNLDSVFLGVLGDCKPAFLG
jgi:archaellum component FlaG (FlaF/FlaG flagellin family)